MPDDPEDFGHEDDFCDFCGCPDCYGECQDDEWDDEYDYDWDDDDEADADVVSRDD